MQPIISKEFEDALERFRGTLLASSLVVEAKREAMDLACAAVEAAKAQSNAARQLRALVQPAGDSDRLKLTALLDLMLGEVSK